MVNFLGKIEDKDIINLTRTQQKTIALMEKESLYLVHTEGNNVKCWLETEDGLQVLNVRKDTVNVLINKKILHYDNDLSLKKTRRTIYYHRLSKDYLNKLQILRERKRINW